ncbi:Respiratory-chain NADH dehydrogenase domain 51 kDa subunit [Spirochaeta thermophila DSM 6578]|uniref:Respiratory-chain NADH dehydrogenase domain 51 kDa subunit n=1 Tax=Winmispira thermophila (strain ATCC 700085 / DSM 6578 / Z-1203) TaxID=869211 RepID=G0GA83_WINT7|nr:NADH-ubiquinone oxidoreductase-F iron-sulfur binding region domain-containing protein [Spirochaeta thermophila]AEJ60919.1 Respiratory-chain NADH dehydrogenase domain 51 kDa subunit [Spirochaeta thermophila DSM 6578]
MNHARFILEFASDGDALDLEACLSRGGFMGLRQALARTPAKVIAEVKASGLRGRGGAGFPTGVKWESVQRHKEPYVVANADEGEPGTFKDRYIMEHAPYLLIEGMTIAGYAVGARRGFIYIRGEYPAIAKGLIKAVEEARKHHFLGEKILGSDYSFDISIKLGGGSYVVGDETALLNSLMGNRGYPMMKPPYPTEEGLWGHPTLVNNVETLAYVPAVFTKGASWFTQIGPEHSPGLKLFCVSGDVHAPGLYELPMGVPLHDLLEAAGGVKGTLKAVQIGGTAGPVYDDRALSFPLDYDSLRAEGGALGSGAVVVMNHTRNMAEFLEVTTRFFSEESCGQCFPCRYGTRQLEFMARNIMMGKGKEEYLDEMRDIVATMTVASFCPFGKSVALPVGNVLDLFGDEIRTFIAHQRYVKEAG